MQNLPVYETRKLHLRNIMALKFGGIQKNLATAINRQPDYISRCLKGEKRIGEAFARHIEQCLEMPTGVMDTPTSDLNKLPEIHVRNTTKSAKEYLEAIEVIAQDTRKIVRGRTKEDLERDTITQKALTLSVLEVGFAIDRILAIELPLIKSIEVAIWAELKRTCDAITKNLLSADLEIVWALATSTMPEIGRQAGNILDNTATQRDKRTKK